jgi:hypothetical protein
MSSPYFAPHEIDIVEWLARRIDDNGFGREMQLIVRPHPQNVQGNMADRSWLPRIMGVRSERVAIDLPALEDSRMQWKMKPHDLPHLSQLLAKCAICFNSGSTLTIDAIIQDRPVVITAFDAGHDLPWWKSARRLIEYPHLAKLIGLGGTRVARSFADLESNIREYIKDPERDAAGRGVTRREECGECDGRASMRVADALTELISRSIPTDTSDPLRPTDRWRIGIADDRRSLDQDIRNLL